MTKQLTLTAETMAPGSLLDIPGHDVALLNKLVLRTNLKIMIRNTK